MQRQIGDIGAAVSCGCSGGVNWPAVKLKQRPSSCLERKDAAEEAARSLHTLGHAVFIPSGTPRDYRFVAPTECTQPIRLANALQDQQDNFAAVHQADFVSYKVVNELLLGSLDPGEVAATSALQGNRMQVIPLASGGASGTPEGAALLVYSTGPIGENVTLAVLQPQPQPGQDPGEIAGQSEHVAGASQSNWKVFVCAELALNMAVQQIVTRVTTAEQARAQDGAVMLVARGDYQTAVLCAYQQDLRDWRSWCLEWRGTLSSRDRSAHCALSASLPELAVIFENGSMMTAPLARCMQPSVSTAALNVGIETACRTAHSSSSATALASADSCLGARQQAPIPPIALMGVEVCPRRKVASTALTKGGRLVCQYGPWPRSLICIMGSELLRIDLRRPGQPADMTVLFELPAGELFCSLATPAPNAASVCRFREHVPHGAPPAASASSSRYLAAACTTSSLLLLDLQQPQSPLLMWSHHSSHQPPGMLSMHIADGTRHAILGTSQATTHGVGRVPPIGAPHDPWPAAAGTSERGRDGGGAPRQEAARAHDHWGDDQAEEEEAAEAHGWSPPGRGGGDAMRTLHGGAGGTPGGSQPRASQNAEDAWVFSQRGSFDPGGADFGGGGGGLSHGMGGKLMQAALHPTQASQFVDGPTWLGAADRQANPQAADGGTGGTIGAMGGRAEAGGAGDEAGGTCGLLLLACAASGDVRYVEFHVRPASWELQLQAGQGPAFEASEPPVSPGGALQLTVCSAWNGASATAMSTQRGGGGSHLRHPRLSLSAALLNHRPASGAPPGLGCAPAPGEPGGPLNVSSVGWRPPCFTTARSLGLVRRLCAPVKASLAAGVLKRLQLSRCAMHVDARAERYWNTYLDHAGRLAILKDEMLASMRAAPDLQGVALLPLPTAASSPASMLLLRLSFDGDVLLQRCCRRSHSSTPPFQPLSALCADGGTGVVDELLPAHPQAAHKAGGPTPPPPGPEAGVELGARRGRPGRPLRDCHYVKRTTRPSNFPAREIIAAEAAALVARVRGGAALLGAQRDGVAGHRGRGAAGTEGRAQYVPPLVQHNAGVGLDVEVAAHVSAYWRQHDDAAPARQPSPLALLGSACRQPADEVIIDQYTLLTWSAHYSHLRRLLTWRNGPGAGAPNEAEHADLGAADATPRAIATTHIHPGGSQHTFGRTAGREWERAEPAAEASRGAHAGRTWEGMHGTPGHAGEAELAPRAPRGTALVHRSVAVAGTAPERHEWHMDVASALWCSRPSCSAPPMAPADAPLMSSAASTASLPNEFMRPPGLLVRVHQASDAMTEDDAMADGVGAPGDPSGAAEGGTAGVRSVGSAAVSALLFKARVPLTPTEALHRLTPAAPAAAAKAAADHDAGGGSGSGGAYGEGTAAAPAAANSTPDASLSGVLLEAYEEVGYQTKRKFGTWELLPRVLALRKQQGGDVVAAGLEQGSEAASASRVRHEGALRQVLRSAAACRPGLEPFGQPLAVVEPCLWLRAASTSTLATQAAAPRLSGDAPCGTDEFTAAAGTVRVVDYTDPLLCVASLTSAHRPGDVRPTTLAAPCATSGGGSRKAKAKASAAAELSEAAAAALQRMQDAWQDDALVPPLHPQAPGLNASMAAARPPSHANAPHAATASHAPAASLDPDARGVRPSRSAGGVTLPGGTAHPGSSAADGKTRWAGGTVAAPPPSSPHVAAGFGAGQAAVDVVRPGFEEAGQAVGSANGGGVGQGRIAAQDERAKRRKLMRARPVGGMAGF